MGSPKAKGYIGLGGTTASSTASLQQKTVVREFKKSGKGRWGIGNKPQYSRVYPNPLNPKP